MPVTFTGDPSAHTNKPHGKDIAYGWGTEHKALKPKIDGIAFTYDIPIEHRDYVKANLVGLGEEPGEPWKPLIKTKMYSLRRSLRHPASGESILIEAAPPPPPGLKAPVSYLRFKFNPAKLGPDGVAFLRDRLTEVFLIEHPWSLIASHCTVTQMDVAADLLGVKTGDLLVGDYKPGSAKAGPLKRMFVFSAAGALESLYLVGKSAKVRLYNKRQELIDKKEPAAFGGTAYTRIEMVTKPQRPITKLAAMTNPFGKLTVHNLTKPVEPPDGLHNWTFFLDCCRVRGLKAALALLPTDELRQAYQDALSAAEVPIWKPEKLWAKWPAVLEASGLLPE